jgi:hypothetical protein
VQEVCLFDFGLNKKIEKEKKEKKKKEKKKKKKKELSVFGSVFKSCKKQNSLYLLISC